MSVCKSEVTELASLYGIDSKMIRKIKEFPSYDDQVFLIDIKPEYCTQNVFPIIIKCVLLRDIHRVDLWIELANHLLKNGISTPKPILLLKPYAAHHPYIHTIKQPNTIYVYTIQHTPSFLKHLGSC
eukprot:658759_1